MSLAFSSVIGKSVGRQSMVVSTVDHGAFIAHIRRYNGVNDKNGWQKAAAEFNLVIM